MTTLIPGPLGGLAGLICCLVIAWVWAKCPAFEEREDMRG